MLSTRTSGLRTPTMNLAWITTSRTALAKSESPRMRIQCVLAIRGTNGTCGSIKTSLWNCAWRWEPGDRKSTRLNSSHVAISYAVFCLKKKRIGGAQPREGHQDLQRLQLGADSSDGRDRRHRKPWG